MDLDSLLIVGSLLGVAMAGFWAKWWDATLRRTGLSRSARIAGVLALSLATLAVAHIGPWIVMMIRHGVVEANLAEPKFSLGMLILFGPGIIIQIALALHTATRPGRPVS